MHDTCLSLARFARFHDSCVKQIEADPLQFDPQLLAYAKQQLQILIDTSDLSMRIQPDALEKIVADDRFKQMMELGRGTTMGGPSARREVVATMFDVDPNTLTPSDYPKFGYLGCRDKRFDFFQNPDMAHQYGSIIVTFKREQVLPRTTIVFGDSVNFGAFRYKVPTWAKAPHPICLAALAHHGAKALPPHIDRAQIIKAFSILCATNKLTPKTLQKMSELFNDRPGCEFFELQFHGDLIFSRDVESIDLMPWGDDSVNETVLNKIRALNITVRQETF